MNIELKLNRIDKEEKIQEANDDNMTHLSKQSVVNKAVGRTLPSGQPGGSMADIASQSGGTGNGFGRATLA